MNVEATEPIFNTISRNRSSKDILGWDLICRVVPCLFFLFVLIANVSELISFLQEPGDRAGYGLYLLVSSRVSIILFIALHCVLFIIRLRPVEKAAGSWPRIAALTGTFFFAVLALLDRSQVSLFKTTIGTLLVLIGNCLATAALSALGRSFSMMAEARRLVTRGGYSYVRHPMYLSEAIALAGVVLQVNTWQAIIVFAVHLWIQIQRMKNEEKVLERTFPEYQEYKLRTARLIPRVY